MYFGSCLSRTVGRLPTPRSPAERVGEHVRNCEGADVTAAFFAGASAALELAQREGCRCALLKERSPSCGSSVIYDGSFTGKRIPGEGVTAELLRCSGIAVFPRISWRSFLPGSLRRSHDRRLSRRLEWPIRAVTGQASQDAWNLFHLHRLLRSP